MTAATAPVEAFIPIRRVRNGRPVEGELFVAWCPDMGTLAVGEGWLERRQRFRTLAGYLVVGFEAQVPGRAFRLCRSSHDIDRDPERVRHYSLLIGDTREQDACDCRGMAAAETRQMRCKHVEAIRWLIQEGHL